MKQSSSRSRRNAESDSVNFQSAAAARAATIHARRRIRGRFQGDIRLEGSTLTLMSHFPSLSTPSCPCLHFLRSPSTAQMVAKWMCGESATIGFPSIRPPIIIIIQPLSIGLELQHILRTCSSPPPATSLASGGLHLPPSSSPSLSVSLSFRGTLLWDCKSRTVFLALVEIFHVRHPSVGEQRAVNRRRRRRRVKDAQTISILVIVP